MPSEHTESVTPLAAHGDAAPDHRDPGGPPARPADSVHVYGRQAAVCVSHDRNRRGEPTVTLEFARADGVGGYDFRRKVAFQCSHAEFAELTAVLWYPGAALTRTHRSSALKTLTLRYAPPNVLVELQAPGGAVTVPIAPGDQHFLRTWLLQHLASVQAAPPSVVLHSLRLLAEQLRGESQRP